MGSGDEDREECDPTDMGKFIRGNRVVKIWNSLPATVEDFASIRKFKSFIERVNLSQYVHF